MLPPLALSARWVVQRRGQCLSKAKTSGDKKHHLHALALLHTERKWKDSSPLSQVRVVYDPL